MPSSVDQGVIRASEEYDTEQIVPAARRAYQILIPPLVGYHIASGNHVFHHQQCMKLPQYDRLVRQMHADGHLG